MYTFEVFIPGDFNTHYLMNLKIQHNDTNIHKKIKQHKNKRGENVYIYFLFLSNESDPEKKID